MERTITKELSFSTITLKEETIGEDIHLILEGGDEPHIGCTVMAEPRPSLTGDGSVGVTSSVINRLGHKDEKICRYVAEKVAIKKNTVVVCTGGFHVDSITDKQIQETIEAVCNII